MVLPTPSVPHAYQCLTLWLCRWRARSTLSLKELADGAAEAEVAHTRAAVAEAVQEHEAQQQHQQHNTDDASSYEDDGDDEMKGAEHAHGHGNEASFTEALLSPPRSPRNMDLAGFTVPQQRSPRRRRLLQLPAGKC